MKLRLGRTRGRIKGFTLPEVIVTITLIAILASVVVPAIVGQVKKGDPSRMGSDYMAVRGGAEQFLSDVRRYPSSISQLTTTIDTSMTPLTGTSIAKYGMAEVNRWRGPYLSKDATAALATGFGLSFTNAFEVDTLLSTGTANTPGGQKYMVLSISHTGLDTAGINDFDRQFDDGVANSGSIRSTTSKIWLLLMPIY